MKLLNLYEITPNGESLKLESRKVILETFFPESKDKIIFNSGTEFTNPDNILSEIKNGDYLIFINNDKNVILIKWDKKFKNKFINTDGTTHNRCNKIISGGEKYEDR